MPTESAIVERWWHLLGISFTSTVAALVGMVPQGLVLLTSIAFGAAAVTLAAIVFLFLLRRNLKKREREPRGSPRVWS